MQVELTIWRDEEPLWLDVKILKYYKGTNDTDNPTTVEADNYGFDQDGNSHELTLDEMAEAEAQYLTNNLCQN